MHPNQGRPSPLLPIIAHAWGTRPAPLDTSRYFETLEAALAHADGQAGVDTVLVEDTLKDFPHRANGRIYRKVERVWVLEDRAEPRSFDHTRGLMDDIMKGIFGVERRT